MTWVQLLDPVWLGLIHLGGVCVEAKPALYWSSLLKWSDVKWLAHTYNLTRTAASMLLIKMKCNQCLFCSSVAGAEYRHWCWFLCVSSSERRHCKTLLVYRWTLQTSTRGWTPPLGHLQSSRRGSYKKRVTRWHQPSMMFLLPFSVSVKLTGETNYHYIYTVNK